MKILLINKFFFMKGGSEAIFFDTAKLLREKGHEVIFFSMLHPSNLDSPYSQFFLSHIDYEKANSIREKTKASLRLLFSIEAQRKLKRLVEKEKPDLAHLHNIHHQISPSILYTLKKFNIPTVMTIHDYKLVCPVYTMLSGNKICEKCRKRRFYSCFFYRCSKGSYLKSLLNTVEMYLHHQILDVYHLVDVFISPSRFLKDKLNEMGFSAEIVHLQNFIDLDSYQPYYSWEEKSVVYIGRLSQEKGLKTLFQAIEGLPLRCKIFGDGPQRIEFERLKREGKLQNISFFGHHRQPMIREVLRRSMFLVLPSEWYENNPRAVIEAFSCGKPVVASRIGGIPEIIKDYETGLTFKPKSSIDLREKIEYLLKNEEEIKEFGKKARNFVEKNCNPEIHYRELIKIYERARVKHA